MVPSAPKWFQIVCNSPKCSQKVPMLPYGWVPGWVPATLEWSCGGCAGRGGGRAGQSIGRGGGWRPGTVLRGGPGLPPPCDLAATTPGPSGEVPQGGEHTHTRWWTHPGAHPHQVQSGGDPSIHQVRGLGGSDGGGGGGGWGGGGRPYDMHLVLLFVSRD